MSLTQKDLDHLLQLSYLELSQDEKKQMLPQLSSVLDHFRSIDKLNLKDVNPTTSTSTKGTPLRSDKVVQKFEFNLAQNAPEIKDNAFVVPKILASD